MKKIPDKNALVSKLNDGRHGVGRRWGIIIIVIIVIADMKTVSYHSVLQST